MLTYDNLANPKLSQGNPSSKLFFLINFLICNYQFPAHHEKLIKTNKYQYIITKKFNLISRWDAAAHQGLNEITVALSTLIRGNIEHWLGTTNGSIFFPRWTKLCKTVAEVKTRNAFHRRVILKTRFSPGNYPGRSHPEYWEDLFC